MAWYEHITVEPCMFLYMMAYMITNVVEQSFYVHQACTVNHGFSQKVCQDIGRFDDVNKQVQITVSTFHQWNGVAGHIVPLILAFFIGSYSDKRGRKIILLGGFVGKLLFSVMLTVNSMNAWPVEYVIYTASIPSALTGSDLAIFAGCFAYIADVSSVKNRTLRVGILDVVYLSTMPIGVALGNVLFKAAVGSYATLFAINTMLMLMATIYAFACLKWQTRAEQKALSEPGVLSDFFDFRNVTNTLRTLTQKRPHHRRSCLWVLLAAMAFYTFQRDERTVMYLYTIKVFGWDVNAFSHFRTYLSTMYVAAMLVGLPLMNKVLKLRDSTIVLLGCIAHICGHFVYAHARDDTLWLLGATFAALGPCVAPLIRSMASKVLPSSERGVVYAFLSVMENAVSMFSAVVYAQLYKATFDTELANSTFYLTIATQTVVLGLILALGFVWKGEPLKMDERDEPEEQETTYL